MTNSVEASEVPYTRTAGGLIHHVPLRRFGDYRTMTVNFRAWEDYCFEWGVQDDSVKAQFHHGWHDQDGLPTVALLPRPSSSYDPETRTVHLMIPAGSSEKRTNRVLLHATQNAIDHVTEPEAYMKESRRVKLLKKLQTGGIVGTMVSALVMLRSGADVEALGLTKEVVGAGGASAALAVAAHGLFRVGRFECRARAARRDNERFITFNSDLESANSTVSGAELN